MTATDTEGPTMAALAEEIGATFLSSLKGVSDFEDYEGSLAMTLLRSTDQKVVAAAKRIFLNVISGEAPKPTQIPETPNDSVERHDDRCEDTDVSILTEHSSAAVTTTGLSRNAKEKPAPTGFSSHGGTRTKPSKSADSKKKQSSSERLQRR